MWNRLDANPELALQASGPPVSAEEKYLQNQGPEYRQFLKNNPNYKYLPRDPRFPNREEGIYPMGPGNEWRDNPDSPMHDISQGAVDLHLLKHSLVYGGLSAALVGGGAGLAAVAPGAMPAVTSTVKSMTALAQKHPRTAMAIMWGLNNGLRAVGLPKAAQILDNIELPMLVMMGGGAEGGIEQGAEQAAEETGAKEAIQSGEEAVANKAAGSAEAAAAAPAVKPTAALGSAEYVDQASEAEQGAKPMFEDVETIPKAQRQAASDRYFQEHPEKRPQPKIIGRGPNKGQQKIVRVFDQGKWEEVPVYK